MTDYIKLISQEVPDDMIWTAVTLAGKCLFTINGKPIVLENEKKDTFIHIVMQLLYLSQRA